MLPDAPTYLQQERVECSIQAAQHYQIPALVLLAVAEQEGGRAGQKVRNRNGTFDYGSMQINTVSLADLRHFGIQEKHVLADGCYPYYLAAWRIAGHLKHDGGDIWQRAANYHSRTAFYNRPYRNQLIRRARKIASRLNGSFLHKPANAKENNNSNHETAKYNQAKDELARVTFTLQGQAGNAYTAPIRVKSFDALNSYSMPSTMTGSFLQTKLPMKW